MTGGLQMDVENNKKKTILIVDDVELNRAILEEMLSTEYNVLEAESGAMALSLIKEHETELSLILLDIVMPEMTGFDVLAVMQKNHWHETIPVVIISSESSTEYIRKGYEYGAVDYISRPFDINIVQQRVKNTILIFTKQKQLESLVKEQVIEKEKNNTLMIDILSTVVEFRNGESGLHVIRIRIITEIILNILKKHYPEYEMDEFKISMISNAAALHDIGKIAVPEEILNKPGRLTPEEFEVVKTHSAIGDEMLKELKIEQDELMVKYARQICRWHHERWDGHGYPDGLKGNEIPISAQVVALADVYDALVSERVYKPAYSHDKAIGMILGGECGLFNPELMACLEEVAPYLDQAVRLRSKHPEKQHFANKLSEELLNKNGIAAMDRTLFLLEHEQLKCQFMSSLSKDILFEYDVNTDIMEFSGKGMKRLSLSPMIMGFLAKKKCHGFLLFEELESVCKKVWATTPEKPGFSLDTTLKDDDGTLLPYRLTGRSIWLDAAEKPAIYSVIGKLSAL